MLSRFSTRREFINYGRLSLLFLLYSCGNNSNKVKISLQKSFYPKSFKDTIPKRWTKEEMNFGSAKSSINKNVALDSDFTLINDGWITNINFRDFEEIDEYLFLEKLDKRSTGFLNSFNENQRSKLFPVGVVPYAIIIKNNKELINSARTSWDFLLFKKLKKKIIFPQSPRILISIANKINSSNALEKLKNQAMLFDDKNMLNWLINSEACVAIVPYSLCSKYLKIDPRLSIVFPKQGVPLMWHFVLSRSKQNNSILINWIKSLENKPIVDKLVRQGWYLPFKNNYMQSMYKNLISTDLTAPSQGCWENSWSFPILTTQQKTNLEKSWYESLTP